MLSINLQMFFYRWYLASALRSGKLKILVVVQNIVEDKNAALTNGVESRIEKIPEASKPVINNTQLSPLKL